MRKFNWKTLLRGLAYSFAFSIAAFSHASVMEWAILFLILIESATSDESQSQLERIEQKLETMSARPH